MTFKHADAKIDDRVGEEAGIGEHRLGDESEEGTGVRLMMRISMQKQTRWKTTDGEKDKMFPFGLLDGELIRPGPPKS